MKFPKIFIDKLLTYEQYLFFMAENKLLNQEKEKNKRHVYTASFIIFLLILIWGMQFYQVNWSPLLSPTLILIGLCADRVTAYLAATIIPTVTTFLNPIIHCVYDERDFTLAQIISTIKVPQSTTINLFVAITSYLVVIEICIIVKYIIEDGESDNKFLRDDFLNRLRKKSNPDSLDDNL